MSSNRPLHVVDSMSEAAMYLLPEEQPRLQTLTNTFVLE